MRVGIFGGSFDPVHIEHRRLVCAAKEALSLDKIVVVPSFVAPHKRGGAAASGEDRLSMLELAFRDLPYVEISDFELSSGGTSYTYLTCEYFAERYADAERFFLVGADMLEDFFTWRNPERILQTASLAACGRGAARPAALREKFLARFGKEFAEVPFTGEAVSSTEIRTALAFGKQPEALDSAVYAYLRERGLYTHPAILPALALEKPDRREHSYRVALLAGRRARSFHLSEEKALLAAALHDCAKNLPPNDPLLEGFVPPEGVPEPVMHQFSGAFLAERVFGISDEEILDAIRYHSSGKEDMSPLGMLVYLADLLEEGRTFEGAEELRRLFSEDLETCMLAALEHQIAYLHARGGEIYGLTERAYVWYKNRISSQIMPSDYRRHERID